jgi:hypothetical protein
MKKDLIIDENKQIISESSKSLMININTSIWLIKELDISCYFYDASQLSDD